MRYKISYDKELSTGNYISDEDGTEYLFFNSKINN